MFLQPDRLKSPPKGASVFPRNNLWMVNTARVEVKRTQEPVRPAVWDETADRRWAWRHG